MTILIHSSAVPVFHSSAVPVIQSSVVPVIQSSVFTGQPYSSAVPVIHSSAVPVIHSSAVPVAVSGRFRFHVPSCWDKRHLWSSGSGRTCRASQWTMTSSDWPSSSLATRCTLHSKANQGGCNQVGWSVPPPPPTSVDRCRHEWWPTLGGSWAEGPRRLDRLNERRAEGPRRHDRLNEGRAEGPLRLDRLIARTWDGSWSLSETRRPSGMMLPGRMLWKVAAVVVVDVVVVDDGDDEVVGDWDVARSGHVRHGRAVPANKAGGCKEFVSAGSRCGWNWSVPRRRRAGFGRPPSNSRSPALARWGCCMLSLFAVYCRTSTSGCWSDIGGRAPDETRWRPRRRWCQERGTTRRTEWTSLYYLKNKSVEIVTWDGRQVSHIRWATLHLLACIFTYHVSHPAWVWLHLHISCEPPCMRWPASSHIM